MVPTEKQHEKRPSSYLGIEIEPVINTEKHNSQTEMKMPPARQESHKITSKKNTFLVEMAAINCN